MEVGSYFRWKGIRDGFLEEVFLAESERINGVNKKGRGILVGGKSTCNGWEARNNRKQWEAVNSSSYLGSGGLC